LIPYEMSRRQQWDTGIANARNGHFMFRRGYMEYHGDRFEDSSYLLLRGSKLVALLPAHRRDDELLSHRGLSFGGWIVAPSCLHQDLRAGFALLDKEMKGSGLRRLVYMPMPYPYHVGPCGDDLFLLSRLGAECIQTRLGAFLANSEKVARNSEFRRRLVRAAEEYPLKFEETDDVERFWQYLTAFLMDRHAAAPVHSADEMRLLRDQFPASIRLIVGRRGGDWVVGKAIFLSRQVLRFQYGFWRLSEPRAQLGFRSFEWLREHPELKRPWLDLGTSMDPVSGELMDSLHLYKEIYGARGVALTTWIWQP
jgi:hypothetical protein